MYIRCIVLVDEGRDDPNTTESGLSPSRQRNAGVPMSMMAKH